MKLKPPAVINGFGNNTPVAQMQRAVSNISINLRYFYVIPLQSKNSGRKMLLIMFNQAEKEIDESCNKNQGIMTPSNVLLTLTSNASRDIQPMLSAIEFALDI